VYEDRVEFPVISIRDGTDLTASLYTGNERKAIFRPDGKDTF
jgi:hypothetical protein